jgi:hypothetical protein
MNKKKNTILKHKLSKKLDYFESNRIVFFSSFEEENEYTAMRRAGRSFDERMTQIETLRKWAFHKFLLTDNTWPPISKTFKIMPPYTNETS